MANELKHVSVGTEITQAEYEGTAAHVFNSQATGDIMYASSSSQLTRLGIGSTNAVLTVSGGIPAWDTTWTPAGDLLPSADDSYDLGSASAAWQDLFLEGDITLTDAGSITTSAGALTLTSAAAATWSTSAGALTLNGTGGVALQEGGSPIISISDARAVTTANTASITLDASGVIELNSSGGVLSVGNDNVDQNVNIATAGTRTLNIGINDGTDLTTITSKGNITNTGTLTVGVDDTGYDVKFFGASAGAYMEWDESADQLRIVGPSADATTSTGKLLLATALTDINANDVLGKIDFQAPLEATGTDAIAIAASIQAVAQATFTATVNSTDLLFMTGDSEAATEKFRITSQGELGVGGANYGSDGDVLTSGGAGAAPAWETPTTGDITGVTAGTGLSGGGSSGGVTVNLDSNSLTEAAIANGDYIVFNDATDSNAPKREALADVATLFAGTGLTASSSVIAVDDVFLRNDASDTTSGTVTMAHLIIGDGGNIGSASDTDAIAISSGGVTTFSQQAVASKDILIDSSLGSDGAYSGITASFTAGEALEIGECVYLKAADSRVWKAVSVVSGTGLISAEIMCIGVVVADQGSAGSAVTVLLQGFLRADGNFPTYTVGETLYVPEAEVGGKNVPEGASPDTDGDFVQVIGWAVTADSIYVNPDFTIIEHA